MKKGCFVFVFFATLVMAACDRNDTLFTKLSSGKTGIHFSNTITENDSVNIISYYYCYNGGGVGIADFDNDSLPDIFFTGNMVSSKLYLNKAEMQFEDITAQAGVTTQDWIQGVSVVDINNDGWMDIYLNVAGPAGRKAHHNLLFINQGKQNGQISFKEEAAAYGLNDSSWCVQSAFFDFDRDGDLDMYLLTNTVDGVEKTMVRPASFPITRGITIDKLYENTGDAGGHPVYKDVSKQSGITEEGYGLGLAIADLNNDGWPDVYAANDFMPNDQMLINQKDKTFKESAAQSMRHQTYSGMGVDIADINNDLKPDIMVVDMLPENNERRKTMIARQDYDNFNARIKAGYVNEYMRNTLQINQGVDANGVTYFSDISQLTGMHATDWSWSVLLADFDNDGLRDTYITNGFAKNITDLDFLAYGSSPDNYMFGTTAEKIKQVRSLLDKLKSVNVSNYIFKNKGDLQFENQTEAWGIKANSFSNGAAYADLDNDGDLDMVTNNINAEAFVYENHAGNNKSKNNYLKVALHGSEKNVNGIGASIVLYYGADKLYEYVSPVKGYLSSMLTPVCLGVGKHTVVDSLRITWADGKTQIIKNIPANRQIELDYKDGSPAGAPAVSEPAFFSKANQQYNIHYCHTENNYNDFDVESLLPKLYSRRGPGIATGDIDNKNGVDFFIGGSANNSGTLFIQNANGNFEQKTINPDDAKYEDMGALFFDADNDGDADLYVVSGGSEFKDTAAAYQDRLYRNDGNGNFLKAGGALPLIASSGGCVVGADFDKDGDVDLFRAGAIQAGTYPTSPRSYILQNDKGKFTDITEKTAPGLANAGMINAAIWTDFDNDDWVDLVVTGEWMQPLFFKNQNGKLVDVTMQTGLTNVYAWWNSIYAADIDNDGDMDYIMGNAGTNIDYKPNPGEPLELYYGYFAGLPKQQPVLSCHMADENGQRKKYPFAFRDDLFKVMPVMKKKFQTYDSYSRSAFIDLFNKDELAKTRSYRADRFQSCVFKNDGNGKFSCIPLPIEAQFSCINGITTADINYDGNMDLLVAGNFHGTEAVYGWLDASLGLLLTGDGKGNFEAVPATKSGLFLSRDTRGISSMVDNKGNEVFLVTANADSLTVLSINNPKNEKVVRAGLEDVYAIIQYKDGRKCKQEFSYGSGYLSQSDRTVMFHNLVQQITIVDWKGAKRIIQ